MKILLFGTGDYYRKYRDWFRREDILGLIDNDENKTGTLIDGHMVYLPQDAVKLPFECVVILSVHEEAMRRQLLDLGVLVSRIYIFSDLYMHPELTVTDREVCLWGKDKMFARMMEDVHANTILLMSHNLDLNGAALVLFYLSRILVKNGFSVFFASWSDGALRQHLYRENIPVIIDPNLQIRTQREVEWVHGFHKIICNTLNYYQFLSDRNTKDKVIWWLHDPVIFYRSLNKELLYKIKGEGLMVCAVSPLAEMAFKEYFPSFAVKNLLYGIPDVSLKKVSHEKLEFITIGNVQEYKGQKILIEALKQLDGTILEQIHVSIVGFQPSAYANDVKNSAKSLEGIVDIKPPVDREEIQRILDRADVLICPSLVDTMSVVVTESMQHSLPYIVSEAAGIAAYIKDGEDGFTFESENVSELSEKIHWCVEHRDRLEEMGKKARRIYERYFSMDVFERNVMQLVRSFM